MPAEEGGVRHTRVLESFEDFRDKEVVFNALQAAKLLVGPDHGIHTLLARAIEHRSSELRDTYNARAQGWKRSPD